MFGLLLLSLTAAKQYITYDFTNVTFVSKTQLTLQVVINPLLDPRTCHLAKAAWALVRELSDLGATHIRYAAWFPYPRVAVAELKPPDMINKISYWNFTDIAPMLDEFLQATLPNPIVLDFSTQPAWFYNGSWSYPSDPRTVDWGYSDGEAPYSNTTRHLAEYYGRFAQWLVKGYFQDEFGNNITGGPALGSMLTHWEVYNEPEGCHGIDPPMYNQEYDAIVTAIRKQTQSSMKFVGLALEDVESTDYVAEFLNRSLHVRGVPLDYFSFHRYSTSTNRTDPAAWEVMIVPDVDEAAPLVANLVSMRDQINPSVLMSLDELGTILPDDNDNHASEPLPLYYQASAAMFAYSYVTYSAMGIDILGMSQLVGTPPIPSCGIPDAQYPSVSMFDWNTGKGNARADVLKLLLRNCAVGTQFVATTSTPAGPVIARAFISANDNRNKILLINPTRFKQSVVLPHLTVHLSPFDVVIRNAI